MRERNIYTTIDTIPYIVLVDALNMINDTQSTRDENGCLTNGGHETKTRHQGIGEIEWSIMAYEPDMDSCEPKYGQHHAFVVPFGPDTEDLGSPDVLVNTYTLQEITDELAARDGPAEAKECHLWGADGVKLKFSRNDVVAVALGFKSLETSNTTEGFIVECDSGFVFAVQEMVEYDLKTGEYLVTAIAPRLQATSDDYGAVTSVHSKIVLRREYDVSTLKKIFGVEK